MSSHASTPCRDGNHSRGSAWQFARSGHPPITRAAPAWWALGTSRRRSEPCHLENPAAALMETKQRSATTQSHNRRSESHASSSFCRRARHSSDDSLSRRHARGLAQHGHQVRCPADTCDDRTPKQSDPAQLQEAACTLGSLAGIFVF